MGALWRDSGLNWADLLPDTEDVHSFISENVSYSLHYSAHACCIQLVYQRVYVEKRKQSRAGFVCTLFILICTLPFEPLSETRVHPF